MWLSLLLALSSEIDTDGVGETRPLAVAAALKEAVGRVAGVYVESRFSATQSETTAKKKTEFLSQVTDQTKTSTEGFIETYKVISESKEGSFVRVKVRSTVNTRRFDDLFGRLSDVLEKRGKKPKVFLAAREVGEASGLATPFIEAALVNVGLDVVREESLADVVVNVDANYKNLGVIGKGAEFAALEGQTRVEIALIMKSTMKKRLVQSKTVSMSSVGINVERAVGRALGGQGNNAIKQATNDFFAALLKELEKEPAAFALRIEGVSSFKKQGQPIVELVRGLPKTRQVQERGFEDGVLKIEVDYDGTRDELESALFGGCESKAFCKSIDRVSATPASLILKL